MLQKNKRLIAHLLILLVFSLLPFLWLQSGQAILGHDAGFPLSPWEHFLDRLHVWSHRFGLGNDQTTEIGGFFIHGFEGIVAKLGFSLTQVQQITFSAYFFGFGTAMYFLAREIFPKREKYLPLIASLFYMLNHFILQAWFIVERTKFTLYIALPIALAIIIRVTKQKTHPVVAGIWASLLIFFLNGGGFFPLYGAILIVVPFMMISLVLFSEEKLKTFLRLLSFTGVWFFGTLLLSSFWLAPYFRFIVTSYAQEVSVAGGVAGVVAWVTTISENASFFNLFRLQGIPEWYANPLHPYAEPFLNNLLLILVSYALGILAFGSFLVAKGKEKKWVIMLIGLTLFSMFFVGGSHPPFGFIYVWLIQNIPGFIAFRTPFYKFAPALWLAYALLIAYTVSFIATRYKKRINPLIVVGGFTAILCIYNYPFFLGNFFDYEVDQKTTKVSVPDYVFDYAEWANSDEFPYKRLLLLPGQNPDTRFEAYTWGYWSLAQIQGLLNNQSYIGNSLYKADTEEVFLKNLFDLVDKGDPSWVDQAQYLFVDAVLLRKDFDYKLENSPTTDPNVLEKFLDEDPRFTKDKEFGEWIIYRLQDNPQSFAIRDYYYEVLANDKKLFFEATSVPGVKLDPKTIFVEENIPELSTRKKGTVYIPGCVHCLLGQARVYPVDREQIVTAGSVFYETQVKRDDKELESITDPTQKVEVSARQSLKRLYQLQNQFYRKDTFENRMIGWETLNTALERQSIYLNEYFDSLETYGIDQNRFIEILSENMDFMQIELDIPKQQIDQEDEAAMYFQTEKLIAQIRGKINEKLWYTEDNIAKRYFFESPISGSYEVFIKKNTSNGFINSDADRSTFKVINNSQESPLTISENGDSPWAKLADIQLEEGVNRLEIHEPIVRTLLGNNGTTTLNFAEDNRCNELDLPALERNSYILNFEAESERDIEDLYIFIDVKGTDHPLLPFRGNKFNIEGQKTSYLNTIKLVAHPNDYTLKFCRLSNNPIDAHTVELSEMYIERISEPIVALFKKETSVDSPSQISISSEKKTQTAYDVTISGTGKSLVMFDQRFDPGWQFSDNTILSEHQRLHGYANGWVVEKDSNEDITLSLKYVGQRLHTIGWVISLTTLTIFILGLGMYYLKKKLEK